MRVGAETQDPKRAAGALGCQRARRQWDPERTDAQTIARESERLCLGWAHHQARATHRPGRTESLTSCSDVSRRVFL